MKSEKRRIWKCLLFVVLLTLLAFVSVGCASAATHYINLGGPEVQVDPSSLSATLGVGQQATTTLTINNTGTAPFTFEIGECTPVNATDFLILDHGKFKGFFGNHTYDLVSESEYAALSAEEMGRYQVVYLEPDWRDYGNLNLINLSAYVQAGGVAVINIAGNIGSVNDIDPAGTDYDRSQTHEHATILLPSHPYISGQPYGGSLLASGNFDQWGCTDHGWLTGYPASSQVVLKNIDGTSWVEYPYESGQVIVTTLTYGWGSGGARGGPLENLIEYALHLSGLPWLDENPINGTVAAGELQQVTIIFNASGLAPGVYNGTLNLNITNSNTTNVSVPVTLNVTEFGLSPSTKDVDMPTANPGDRLTYTLVLSNADGSPISALLTDPISEDATYVADSVTGGATYNATENRIEWNGTVPADGSHTITFQVDLDTPLLDGAVIVNTVHIEDLTNSISHWLQIPTDIEAPILAESYKLVDPSIVIPGDTLTFSIFVFNTGSVDALGVTLEDPIPERATYVADSVTGGATYNATENRIEWNGTVPADGSHTITFQVTANPTTIGLPIINRATISHPWVYATEEYAQASVLSGADVLIVEDDYTNTNRRDIYAEALEVNCYTRYDFFTADYAGTPSITTLQSYPVVIWYTGAEWSLNTPDREVITEYLTTGGRLFITGQDLAQQAQESEFLNDTLHVRFVENTPSTSSYTKEVAGMPGEILANISTTVDSYDPDIIEPTDAIAVPIIEYTGTANGTAGIRFIENTSRVVFLAFEFEAVTVEEDRNKLMGRIMDWIFPEGTSNVFDTGGGSYPSISGTHNGTITPSCNLSVSKLYTYPCPGTGGHTEYVKIGNNAGWNVTARWNGYSGDWHNITFNTAFTLYANETYNYTIVTGSYPQIIHATSYNATGGVITCSEFIDVNGKQHEGWIPAIRLE
jgi:uncharacterized repeat protein (TIGR01451 family)